jgi:hypothetical protein
MRSLFLPGSGRSLPQAPVGEQPIATGGGYLSELRSRLTAFAEALRGRRQHGDQLEAEVCLDVVADAAAAQARAGERAYTAEQADLEAARLLSESLADGRITAEEIPCLRSALRHVNRSAQADHQITEVLA